MYYIRIYIIHIYLITFHLIKQYKFINSFMILKKYIQKILKKIYYNLKLYYLKKKYIYINKNKNNNHINQLFNKNPLFTFIISQFIFFCFNFDLSLAYCLNEEEIASIVETQVDIIEEKSGKLIEKWNLYKIKNNFYQNIANFIEGLKSSHLDSENHLIKHNYFISLCEKYGIEMNSYCDLIDDEILFQEEIINELVENKKLIIGEILPNSVEPISTFIDSENIEIREKNVSNPPLILKSNYVPLTQENLDRFNYLNNLEIIQKFRNLSLEEDKEVFSIMYRELREKHFSFRTDGSDKSNAGSESLARIFGKDV